MRTNSLGDITFSMFYIKLNARYFYWRCSLHLQSYFVEVGALIDFCVNRVYNIIIRNNWNVSTNAFS